VQRDLSKLFGGSIGGENQFAKNLLSKFGEEIKLVQGIN